MIPTKFHSWKLYFYVPDQCFLTKATARRSNLWPGLIIIVVTLTLGLGASCFVLFFHETWDKILATTTTIANLPVASHVGTAEEGFQALFGSCRRVLADLSGNPTYESCWNCWWTQNQMVPKCEVFLTLLNEMRSLSQKIQNDDSERNIFLHFKIVFTKDEFERMAFFLFSFVLDA